MGTVDGSDDEGEEVVVVVVDDDDDATGGILKSFFRSYGRMEKHR